MGMNIKRTVGEKGQVVVPKDIREHFGIRPGSKVVFEVKEKEIVIRPAKSPKEIVEDFCSLRKKLRKRLDLKDLKRLEEESYDLP